MLGIFKQKDRDSISLSQQKSFVSKTEAENASLQNQLDAISRSMAVIEFDTNGIIQTANENFLRVIGYSLNEITGNTTECFCVNQTSRHKSIRGFGLD